jgi:hypothetical protein
MTVGLSYELDEPLSKAPAHGIELWAALDEQLDASRPLEDRVPTTQHRVVVHLAEFP